MLWSTTAISSAERVYRSIWSRRRPRTPRWSWPCCICAEEGGEQAIDQGAVDDPVDVVEPVAVVAGEHDRSAGEPVELLTLDSPGPPWRNASATAASDR